MAKLINRLIITGMLCWSTSALAAYVEYSDFASWDAGSGGGDLTVISWDTYGIAPGGAFGGWDGYDGINNDIHFSLPGGGAPVIFDEAFDFGGGLTLDLGTGDFIAANEASPITVTLPGNVTGISLNLRGGVAATSTFNIALTTVGGGELFSTVVTNPGGAFWGIHTDSAILSVEFSSAGGPLIMDNFGAAYAVPAPGGLMLVAGLALLGLSSRRRQTA